MRERETRLFPLSIMMPPPFKKVSPAMVSSFSNFSGVYTSMGGQEDDAQTSVKWIRGSTGFMANLSRGSFPWNTLNRELGGRLLPRRIPCSMSSGVKNRSPIWYWTRLKKFRTSLTESRIPSFITPWITMTLYRLIQKASRSSLLLSSSSSILLSL